MEDSHARLGCDCWGDWISRKAEGGGRSGRGTAVEKKELEAQKAWIVAQMAPVTEDQERHDLPHERKRKICRQQVRPATPFFYFFQWLMNSLQPCSPTCSCIPLLLPNVVVCVIVDEIAPRRIFTTSLLLWAGWNIVTNMGWDTLLTDGSVGVLWHFTYYFLWWWEREVFFLV